MPGKTYIILLLHIHFPGILPNPQFLLFAQALNSSVMLLVPDRSGRRQEERSGYHGNDEWEAKERKWVFGQTRAVSGGDGVGLRRGAELLGLEDRHAYGDATALCPVSLNCERLTGAERNPNLNV